MEEATPLSGAATCENEDSAGGKTALSSKSEDIWNNNNNILTGYNVPEEPGGRRQFVTRKSYNDVLNGNDHAAVVVNECCDNQTIISNTDSQSVPVGCSTTQTKSEFTTIKCKENIPIQSTEISEAPYSQAKIRQSAIELIDSNRRQHPVRSSTCPKPVFVDPNKPDRDLQVAASVLDMAATGSSLGTKKTVLANVRLAPASKSSTPSSPLPNGTINNKTPPPSILKVKGVVPNDETPLMGNSQRTDSSSVCVKPSGYGTHVPSNRNDHQQSSSSASQCNNVSPDSDHDFLSPTASESGDGSAGTSNKPPATLGEQFEASKAQEGKKKKSKKKKKKG